MADVNIADLATIQFAIELLLVTVVAMVAWANIPPKTVWTSIQMFIENFVGTLVLAFLVALMVVAGSELDIYTVVGFLSILGITLSGWGGISLLLSKYVPASSPGPPA
jgi:hypothetical protein